MAAVSRDGAAEDGLLPPQTRRSWPGIVDGQLWVPPPEHVLEYLVRQYVLVDDELSRLVPEHEAREAATVAMLFDGLPNCDLCQQASRGEVTARYDTRIGPPGSGWGYLCGDCYVFYPPWELGLGLGQYLLTPDELDDGLRAPFERAREYWRAQGANVPPYSPFSGE